MTPPAKKRKTRSTPAEEVEQTTESTGPAAATSQLQADETVPSITAAASSITTTAPKSADEPALPTEPDSAPANAAAAKARERQERFKALQARAKHSQKANLKEVKAESARLGTDSSLLGKLERKKNMAAEKLEKIDGEARGEDFERKRAWDWTEEESAKWDKRVRKKEGHRKDLAFQDYNQDARKVYKRQVGNMKADQETYEREKMRAIERAAASGGLEIVETEDGELVAVDKDGTFYSSADTLGFVENKPSKDAVDRLVADLQQAEDKRLKLRKERGQDKDEGDVTYINEKNKNFNNKLARFYNKVCSAIFGSARLLLTRITVHHRDSRVFRARYHDLDRASSGILANQAIHFSKL